MPQFLVMQTQGGKVYLQTFQIIKVEAIHHECSPCVLSFQDTVYLKCSHTFFKRDEVKHTFLNRRNC